MVGEVSVPDEFDSGISRANLVEGRGRPLDTPWGPMALFRIGAEVYAVQAFCPHLEGPLFQGSLIGTQLSCPWHGWRFDLCTGERTDIARLRWGRTERIARSAVRESERGTLILTRP